MNGRVKRKIRNILPMDNLLHKHWSDSSMTLWTRITIAVILIPWEIPIGVLIATLFI
tara:strand:- start:769 stop:939 length:171 start_codon:yes stop_codon:yes gene_type:complete